MINLKNILIAVGIFTTAAATFFFANDITGILQGETQPLKPVESKNNYIIDNKGHEYTSGDLDKETDSTTKQWIELPIEEIEPEPNNPLENSDNFLLLVNKTHSISEDYVPSELIIPDVPFVFDGFHEKRQLDKPAALALEELFDGAKKDQIKLLGVSGYRSYTTQDKIFSRNVKKKGFEAANQYSAKPGESEHQTGYAIDVSAPSVKNRLVTALGERKEGIWLAEHAHEYGFIIRYPKGKENITKYQYEPWHLRYVEKGPAKEMYLKGITLEEYLEEL